MEIIEQHFTVDQSGSTLLDLLAENTPLSKQKIKDALLKGCVWQTLGKRTQRVRRAKKVIAVSSEIHLYYNPKVLGSPIPEPTLIHDEKDYSVWLKPSGMLSQGSKWGDHCTITRWAEKHLQPQRNAFVVHRLDRAATGLILVAHTKQAAAKLSALFAERHITKKYYATVTGLWPHSEKVTIESPIDGKPAVSHVKPIDISANESLLEVTIDTGRKHQIRKHLAGLGFPIIGDRLYGTRPDAEQDLQLTAFHLAFTCPLSGQSKSFELPLRGKATL
ncbi:RluA family pseudouridine synthase [Pleionea litopenaei]|uniref:RluA family pseudouridine synthase n=1 Tax=Pleionea litopenaei TaxID=3070815 RepID=A0AA51RW50_9GAMM|nr:RluA family pseudouridine synthase [Pleionea sp. HL-JVS1]WMS88881.1 RluA family pseudouridine synthase [Pleionea sp. HL-JVS1]